MRRYLIVSLIAIAVILVVGGGILVLVNRSPKISHVIEKVANLNTNKATNTNTAVTNTAVVTKVDPNPAAIIYVARNFAEQFGTDSSDSANAGLLASTRWTTTAFASQLQKNVASVPKPTTSTFHSFVTHALTFTITQRTTTTAAVTIGTTREETNGSAIATHNQNLYVTLSKDGTQWKIATAAWATQ